MVRVLFNEYLNGDKKPDEWKKRWITPIHKKAVDLLQSWVHISTFKGYTGESSTTIYIFNLLALLAS